MIAAQIAEILIDTMGLKEQTPDPGLLAPYRPEATDIRENQFAIFLKPETTALSKGVKFAEILKYVLDALENYKVSLGAIRILTSDYLARHEIMDQHYGVINKISKHGEHAISAKARKIIENDFSAELEAGAEILGGHQFLARFPEFSAFALAVLSDNVGVKKLAGGTYCLKAVISATLFLVLNAFHPYQLENFTTGDKVIVVMEGRSRTSWVDLRREMVGATNPAFAFQGSIRQTLLSQSEKFGLAEVGQSANGIHLSAGPLEGMVELKRFFSDPDQDFTLEYDKTAFGRLLLSKKLPSEAIESATENPNVEVDGHAVSTFDLTEELDAEEAAEKLLEVSTQLT